MRLRAEHGQSTLEYAFLLAIIISAIITVQIYVRRGIIGNLHDTAQDRIGSQFHPERTSGTIKHESTGSTTDILSEAGLSTSTLTGVTQIDQYDAADPEKVGKWDPSTETLF